MLIAEHSRCQPGRPRRIGHGKPVIAVQFHGSEHVIAVTHGHLGDGALQAREVGVLDRSPSHLLHRVLQTVVDGKPRTGEVFNYSAHFGRYQVIVAANPLVLQGKPTVPVNTQKARDLLIAGVNAVRK